MELVRVRRLACPELAAMKPDLGAGMEQGNHIYNGLVDTSPQ
ncbi:hypothetical protein AB0O34_33910 [Sphaerisporangium sp. NPDC088356]